MLTLTRPSDRRIEALLASQKDLGFSYAEVGSLGRGVIPAGYVEDHNRVRLGQGEAAWSAAREAIRAWAMFDLGWCDVRPRHSRIEAGTVVAVLAQNFLVWTANPARIIAVIDETGPIDRFGFVYGSLPDHAETGEEQFLVERHRDDDSVWYDLHGFSRPGRWYAKVSHSLTRGVQKRFASDSKARMVRFVEEHARS